MMKRNQECLEKMSDFFNQRADVYDHHMLDEMSLAEFYDEIEQCMAFENDSVKLLDLGCGTGLELERVFKLCPYARVTAIDLSEKMLEKLKQKFIDKASNLTIICGSYFDVNLGSCLYDAALSTYSLHHFNHAEKLALYRKVYESVKSGGRFVNGDYTVKTLDRERFFMEENKRIRMEQGIESGYYHYDTPFAIETEVQLLTQAGFERIDIHKQWENTTLFVCYKGHHE